MKLRNKLWIWGQTPGTHHSGAGVDDLYHVPGTNRMTALEGAVWFGIPNMFRVVSMGQPVPPYDQEAMVLDKLDKVVWSVVGDWSTERNNEQSDIEEVIKLAGKYDNFVGGVMDDFLNDIRIGIYPPERIKAMSERLHTALTKRLDYYLVFYAHELTEPKAPEYLPFFDVVTFWNWRSEELEKLEDNINKLKSLMTDEKPIYCGCYMWDYGNKQPMSATRMKLQLDTYYKWLKEKKIDGIVFCSNCIADVGLEAVDYARKWIEEHAEEEI